MRNKFCCDICGTEIEETSWTARASRLVVKSYCASQNPLARFSTSYWQAQHSTIEHDEVCQECQRQFAEIVADFLQKRQMIRRHKGSGSCYGSC